MACHLLHLDRLLQPQVGKDRQRRASVASGAGTGCLEGVERLRGRNAEIGTVKSCTEKTSPNYYFWGVRAPLSGAKGPVQKTFFLGSSSTAVQACPRHWKGLCEGSLATCSSMPGDPSAGPARENIQFNCMTNQTVSLFMFPIRKQQILVTSLDT